MLQNLKLEIQWAAIFSISSLLWFIIEKLSGLHDKQVDQQMTIAYFFSIPAILIYYFAIKNKKKTVFKGTMTWRQGVVSGVFISAFVAVFSIVVNYICFEFISPNYFTNISNHFVAIKSMSVSDAQSYFTLENYIIEGVFGALSTGVVTSAIVAFFLQTKE